jgi:hypothetical protein
MQAPKPRQRTTRGAYEIFIEFLPRLFVSVIGGTRQILAGYTTGSIPLTTKDPFAWPSGTNFPV